ncbi:MAG: hypothetical protein OXI35_18485 [Gemmatimonadota bacterium]|nr:hypothetical protein [Gemmatimonadota bacterium]
MFSRVQPNVQLAGRLVHLLANASTFGFNPPPISLSSFASDVYPDRSPVAPPDAPIRRKSPS